MQLPFSVVAKPTGAACNLDCSYCFFLSKELLYDEGATQRMSEETLETYIRSFLAAQPDGPIALEWQGGEPTMRGLDFFRRAVDLAREHARPRQEVRHSLQTNGTLLDDEWCAFLAAENFLVGLSVDGPAHVHDAHRVNRAGRGSHAQVIRGWEVLNRHGVDVNILCTVNSANQDHGVEVYRYFRDDLQAQYLQFIPIVERVSPKDLLLAERGWRADDGQRLLYRQAGTAVTSRSVGPEQWGRFLVEICDEWVARDVGTAFVQHFDVMLAARFGEYALCVHAPECGRALAIEHNGDVYSCDHYVEPGHQLGKVAETTFTTMLASPEQREFGTSKRTSLTQQCRGCPVRWACHGGCPKDRFAVSIDGEPGHNYLCEGYFHFFSHAAPSVETMARLLSQGKAPAEIMRMPREAGGAGEAP